MTAQIHRRFMLHPDFSGAAVNPSKAIGEKAKAESLKVIFAAQNGGLVEVETEKAWDWLREEFKGIAVVSVVEEERA